LAVAENAISENAYKPGAIIKSRSGLTVHVGNTDAEGRLVLGDALTFVQETYKPKTIIDVATLTGACVVALGEYAAGLFANDKGLQNQLAQAGEEVMERCWPMPIFPEHTEELESTVADTSSTGKGRYGGASTAAAFLQKFINSDVQWAHLDVAGPAMYSAARGYMPKGSTGFGVQTLVRFLQKQEK
jgi:leucyl aminopeptidase